MTYHITLNAIETRKSLIYALIVQRKTKNKPPQRDLQIDYITSKTRKTKQSEKYNIVFPSPVTQELYDLFSWSYNSNSIQEG